jgi:hypothetical protein
MFRLLPMNCQCASYNVLYHYRVEMTFSRVRMKHLSHPSHLSQINRRAITPGADRRPVASRGRGKGMSTPLRHGSQ